ncbi:hypothetical protein VPHF86_0263 [Vibrio phage F86]
MTTINSSLTVARLIGITTSQTIILCGSVVRVAFEH